MNPQQECFCTGKNCNDIDKCICSGTGMTKYANKAKNAEKSGASEIIASALATVLSAVGAFWLL